MEHVETAGDGHGRPYIGCHAVSHVFLIANIVTTSKALVTRSDALVPSSEPVTHVGLCPSFSAFIRPTFFCSMTQAF